MKEKEALGEKLMKQDEEKIRLIEESAFTEFSKNHYDSLLEGICRHGRHQVDDITEEFLTSFPTLKAARVKEWLRVFWL